MSDINIEHEKAVLWALRYINNYSSKSNYGYFTISISFVKEDPDLPNSELRDYAFEYLSDNKAIKFIKPREEDTRLVRIGSETYYFEKNNLKFNKLLSEYEIKQARQKISFSRNISYLKELNFVFESEREYKKESLVVLKEQLERRYDLVIKEQNGEYFRYIADYIRFILKSPTLFKMVIGELYSLKEKDFQEYEETAKKFRKEIKATVLKLKELMISENILITDEIKYRIDSLNSILSGRSYGYSDELLAIYQDLILIFNSFKESNNVKSVSHFAEIKKDELFFTFAPTYPSFKKAFDNLITKIENSEWGAWEKIIQIYLAIYKKEAYESIIDKLHDRYLRFNFIWISNIIKNILCRDKDYIQSHSDLRIFFSLFDKHLTKFHLYILEIIEDTTEEKTSNNSSVSGYKSIAKIYYLKTSGIGYARKRFRFKKDSSKFNVFGEMYANIGKRIEKGNVLQLSNYDGRIDDKDSNIWVNELAKELRASTGLNRDEIVINHGSLTLVGEMLQVPPNHP